MSTKNPDTKTKILSAAWKLLEKHQGKNVRMDDIAKAAKVSRQAVYLHFESRIGLMVATVQYGDQMLDATTQVQPWRDAEGVEKLDAWIAFWGNYIPQIFGVAKALLIARETDDAAAAAWEDRMKDVRNSCRKTIQSLADTGELDSQWTVKAASDLLWTMLSVQSWEQLTETCGWSTKKYVDHMQRLARKTLVGV